MTKTPTLTLPMTAYQQRILTIPERHDLALLGARGSGKSTALALLILKHVEAYRANAHVLVVRRQHHGVQHIHAICLRLFQQAYPAMSSTTQPATIKTHGALVEFNQIDSTADLSKYLGGNYSLICCDQGDEYPEPELLDLLRSLLRTSADIPCRFCIAGNAGNIGSGWIRSRFLVPGAKPWQPFIEADSQRSFVVTRSLLSDNQFLPQAEYRAQLIASAAGNAMRMRQWFDDDWDTVLDGMFADIWDRRVHVLEPFAIPSDWKITRSFDWGDSRPFSAGWWATSDGTPILLRNGDQRTFPRGTMIAYRGVVRLDRETESRSAVAQRRDCPRHCRA